MVQVGLDGVMMRMNAEKNGDEVIEKEGWREASCGTVTPRDDDGDRLLSRYILYRPSKLQCFGKINRFLDETT